MKKLCLALMIVAMFLVVPCVSAMRVDEGAGLSEIATITTVGFDYTQLTVPIGSTFTLQIMVNDVSGLYGWQWWLNYPSNLQCVSAKEGPFLKQGGSTFAGVGYCSTYANGFATLMGRNPGVSGSGCISTVSFKVIGVGNVVLQLIKVKLVGINPNPIGFPIITIPCNIYDCTIIVT